MVGTVGAARKLGGTRAAVVARVAYAAGLAAGAAAVFGGVSFLATQLHPGRPWLLAAAAVAGLAALVDALGRRVRPQIRHQVPERWRATMPLPLALFLYGALLGTGVATYVPAAAAWALVPLGLALGSAVAPLAIGAGLVAGRAVPVFVLAGRDDGSVLAERPGGLRLVRALAGVALACGVAFALTGRAGADVVAAAEDPSVAAGDVAWQQPAVGGFLQRAGEAPLQLPGTDPAIGGTLVAWHVGDQVTIADRATLTPSYQATVAGVQKLAVDDAWLVVRTGNAKGDQFLVAESLADHTQKLIAGAAWPAQLSRPSLSGSQLVFGVSTSKGSWITLVDLAAGSRRRLRSAAHDAVVNPALLGSNLLYVRLSRCGQQLLLGGLSGGDRRIVGLPPLAGQDIGRDPGHTSQGSMVPCKGTIRPTRQTYWTTALTSRYAYVTKLRPAPGGRSVPTLMRLLRR